MRKLTAIFLLLIFSFNIIGYRIAYFLLEKDNDIQLENNLDKGIYSEKELITIQLPLMNSYQNESDYQRYNGEISYNGMIYKFVKSRVHNGNLELLCIPNHEKSLLEYRKDVAGNADGNTNSKNQNLLKTQFAINEFDISKCNFVPSYDYRNEIAFIFSKCASKIVRPFLDSAIDPPDQFYLS